MLPRKAFLLSQKIGGQVIGAFDSEIAGASAEGGPESVSYTHLAWFFLWVERKAVARMQGRIGPPFMQPFYDFIKLVGKDTPQRTGASGMLMKAWPLIAVSAAAGAVGLLSLIHI